MSPERRKQKTQEILKLMLLDEEKKGEKWTRPEVRSFLFNEGYSMTFEDDVYYGLQKELKKLPKPAKKSRSRVSQKEKLFNMFQKEEK